MINDDVLAKIEALADLAPLHNSANAAGIKAFKKVLPDIVSVGVFDTAFHATMPEVAYRTVSQKNIMKSIRQENMGHMGQVMIMSPMKLQNCLENQSLT